MTSLRSPALQDDQRFALMKFRRSVADVLKPEHDDFYLVRWLNARKWNAEDAEKMLRENFKWRETWKVDQIANFKRPKAMSYSPHGLSGFDKGGSPIIIVPFAGMDMWGSLHAMSRADFIRSTIQMLEHYMDIAYEQSKTHGPGARQFVILFDLKDFNLKQYTWRPAGEVVIQLIKNYAAYYPEVLKCCYLINVPKVFIFVFNIVKKFLDDYTISKISLYNSGSKKWIPKILEHVDPSQLPVHFNGSMTDPDGNPKCITKINYGGKVPVELYVDKSDESSNSKNYDDFIDTVIKKGGNIKLKFNTTNTDEDDTEQTILKWEFQTFDHDIKFGVKRLNNLTGESNIEIALARVASHELSEEGFIPCQPNSTYTVLFDNSYSFFTNKRIRYSVQMASSVDVADLDVEIAAECNEN